MPRCARNGTTIAPRHLSPKLRLSPSVSISNAMSAMQRPYVIVRSLETLADVPRHAFPPSPWHINRDDRGFDQKVSGARMIIFGRCVADMAMEMEMEVDCARVAGAVALERASSCV